MASSAVIPSYKHIVERNNQLVRRLAKYSGLNEKLVLNIVKFSKCLCKRGYDSIDSDMFSVVLSTYFNIVDQTTLMKAYIRQSHGRPDNQLAMEDFAEILCAFLSSDLDLKIDYVFKIYDINGDGYIDSQEISQFVRTCKCVMDTDEADKDETFYDLAHMAANTLGVTGEGITLETFREKVKENGLILSILGEALPNYGYVERFRQKLTDKTNLQMIQMFGNIRYQLLREVPDTTEPRYYPITLDLP